MVIILILTLLTFGIVTIAIVSGYYWASAESPVAQRLKTLVPELGIQARAKKKGPSLGARLLALLGTYSFGGSENSLAQRLSYAGIRGPRAVVLFLGVRTLLSFGPALLVLVPRISSGKPLGYSLLMAGFAWAWGHVLMNLWLRTRVSRRVREIMTALPDTLDLMVTCLEAGLGLNATIARIGEERASLADALGREARSSPMRAMVALRPRPASRQVTMRSSVSGSAVMISRTRRETLVRSHRFISTWPHAHAKPAMSKEYPSGLPEEMRGTSTRSAGPKLRSVRTPRKSTTARGPRMPA